jgi:hypothetical protein
LVFTKNLASLPAPAFFTGDQLVREDGRWKVKHRVAVRDWSVAIPLTYDWDLSNTLTSGARSDADPSYGVLGTQHGFLPA